MSEVIKDCAIKLFGQTIALLPDKVFSDITVTEQRQSSSAESTSQDSEQYVSTEFKENRYEYESIDPSVSATSSDSLSEKTLNDEQPIESSDSQEKTTLKKPDKILPCPRCKSTDTKFCYYNNYNIKQPRHFCKNCHRYWTSGGTMRNVPVGSGRRKNKNAALVPNYHHLMVLDTPQETRPYPTNAFFILGSKGSQDRIPDEFYEHSNAFGPSGYPVSFYPATTYWGSSLPSPKTTLRIDDPNEVAKSSIWSTLGIKIGSTNKMRLFEAFETKRDNRNRSIGNMKMVLQANPAAASRSLNFRESAQ